MLFLCKVDILKKPWFLCSTFVCGKPKFTRGNQHPYTMSESKMLIKATNHYLQLLLRKSLLERVVMSQLFWIVLNYDDPNEAKLVATGQASGPFVYLVKINCHYCNKSEGENPLFPLSKMRKRLSHLSFSKMGSNTSIRSHANCKLLTYNSSTLPPRAIIFTHIL